MNPSEFIHKHIEENSMSEKLTLTVYKNSPHIWAGGLEGEKLARWLQGKANAILWLVKHQQQQAFHKEQLAAHKNSEMLTTAYATLGLSLKETDPILPLSKEAVQFDMKSAELHKQCIGALALTPVGYSQLPDLAEERAIYLETEADQSGSVSTSCEQTKDD